MTVDSILLTENRTLEDFLQGPESDLIIGFGEIGRALKEILEPYYPILTIDLNTPELGQQKARMMHVCFHYSKDFISEVKRYQHLYRPKFTIIHSTVPPGVSRICDAVHSPVIGMHPFLGESLLTFTKFIGGKQGNQVADYFRRAGMKVYLFDQQETTEWMKLLDTTFYKICIEYTQDVKRICETSKIPFEAWRIWTDEYNSGYNKLGCPEYTRPNLTPIMKELGGHCLNPNWEMLDVSATKMLKKLKE